MVCGVYLNCNCFTFTPVAVFVITLNFIKVVRNKLLNGASVTTARVVIHPFASKKLSADRLLSVFNIVHVYVESPVSMTKGTTQFIRIINKY